MGAVFGDHRGISGNAELGVAEDDRRRIGVQRACSAPTRRRQWPGTPGADRSPDQRTLARGAWQPVAEQGQIQAQDT